MPQLQGPESSTSRLSAPLTVLPRWRCPALYCWGFPESLTQPPAVLPPCGGVLSDWMSHLCLQVMYLHHCQWQSLQLVLELCDYADAAKCEEASRMDVTHV